VVFPYAAYRLLSFSVNVFLNASDQILFDRIIRISLRRCRLYGRFLLRRTRSFSLIMFRLYDEFAIKAHKSKAIKSSATVP
jgi:hypothetical protein